MFLLYHFTNLGQIVADVACTNCQKYVKIIIFYCFYQRIFIAKCFVFAFYIFKYDF